MIRELTEHGDLRAVEALQREIWGESIPRGLMVALVLQGGLLAGAFDGDGSGGGLAGFVLGFPTADPAVQHSHMLAVRPGARGGGLGAALKFYQRDWCLARGVTRVEWTFDPLRAANAHFNFNRLGGGVTVRRYLPNLYGEMGGINAGVDSDRVMAEWDLTGAAPETHGEPIHYAPPADFGALLKDAPGEAKRLRAESRETLGGLLGGGHVIVGFDRARGYVIRAL